MRRETPEEQEPTAEKAFGNYLSNLLLLSVKSAISRI